MKSLKQTILKKLTSREPVKRIELLNYLRYKDFTISERHMRLTLAELRDKDGYLLTSSRHGYKLATNRKEVEAALKYRKSYALRILASCKNIRRNFNRQLKPQLWNNGK